jgi:hypothetical protein
MYIHALLDGFHFCYFYRHITKSLKTISDKLSETSLNQKKKIVLEANSKKSIFDQSLQRNGG